MSTLTRHLTSLYCQRTIQKREPTDSCPVSPGGLSATVTASGRVNVMLCSLSAMLSSGKSVAWAGASSFGSDKSCSRFRLVSGEDRGDPPRDITSAEQTSAAVQWPQNRAKLLEPTRLCLFFFFSAKIVASSLNRRPDFVVSAFTSRSSVEFYPVLTAASSREHARVETAQNLFRVLAVTCND